VRRAAVSVLIVALASAAGLASAAPNLQGFGQGVASGEMTTTSARVWTRAPKRGPVTLIVVPAVAKGAVKTFALSARPADDLTVQRVVTGLKPGTTYRYSFSQKGAAASAPGIFTTAPAASSTKRVRFALSGDADATPGTDGKPAFNGFQTYARMVAENNDFNVNMGDTIYSDSEVADSPPALSVPDKWKKYKLGLALAPTRGLRASAGLYSHWDDHEFINDFSRAENGEAMYAAGVKAFRDFNPVSYTAQNGLYRTFRWGKNVELFFLDERTFRSGKAGTACNGDLAPTAPAAVRTAFAALAPSLAQPVAQSCLDTVNDPKRTMLGAAQHARFVQAIKASGATWKVILNEVPLMQLYALPYDRWEGYAAERKQLLADLVGVKNVVVLTTDTHAHLIGEIRTTTFEPPGPAPTGIWEVITGPVATNTYAREIDSALGSPGSGDFVTSLFLKPPLPRGLGLRCTATDTYGYAEVTATATTLTVAPKAAAGGPVKEKTGATCEPLVLRAG
jgi:phosphodiesterase/alkaline phosphatase D-like protein